MTEPRLTRRLAAILAADIAGYSRLMSVDEEDTHRRALAIRREILDPIIDAHQGRVVKNTGDGFLAEFGSPSDAVRCALAMQSAVAAANADTPTDRRILYRMGVNIGDVIVEHDDIFGDGVNIAARLESLAQPGSVVVSEKVREEIGGRMAVAFEDFGHHTVKNIPRPVHVYRVGTEARRLPARLWQVGRSRVVRRTAVLSLLAIALLAAVAAFVPPGPLHDTLTGVPLVSRLVGAARQEMPAAASASKPVVAVMPFDDLTGDPAHAHVADGLAESITATLSSVSNMLVVSRYSVMGYKGQHVPLQQVAREQGVDHVLHGSVQQGGGRFRVSAQLVNAGSGQLVWSERYDHQLQNLLAVEDEITRNIVTALQVNLTEGEQARIQHTATRNFEAWSLAMRGHAAFQKVGPATNAEARRLLQQAIAIDPNYAWAWTFLAAAHALAARFGFDSSPSESMQRAYDAAHRAVELDPNLAEAHSTLGSILLFRREYDQAIDEGRKAVALGPSNSEAHALLAQTLYYSGEFREALPLLDKALQLSPRHPAWYLIVKCAGHAFLGEYDAGIAAGRRARELAESPFGQHGARVVLAFALAEAGRVDEARGQVAEAIRILPDRGIKAVARGQLFRNPMHAERVAAAFRLAGLPE